MRKAGAEILKPKPAESLLEIGFGTGHTLVALAKAVGPKGRVFGLDLSDKMARLTKENLAKAGLLDSGQDSLQRRGAASILNRRHGRGLHGFHAGVVREPDIPKVGNL